MKVLLSVFSCNPYAGSDAYVGWAYAVNMAQFNEVYAFTREENRTAIEKYCKENVIDNMDKLHFYYIKQSEVFIKYLYKINHYLGFFGSYFIWQRDAYKLAKKICKEISIDLCHHVSIADYRCAGELWKLGKPFIFGPVGGGQETSECLSEYIRGHEKAEKIRHYLNVLIPKLPGYRKALQKAARIYSSNDETSCCIRKYLRQNDENKLVQMTELCINESYLAEREQLEKKENDKVHIIVSGRLIYRKGVSLLLDVIKCIQTEVPYVVDIYGDGDQRSRLERKAQELEIAEKVIFWGKFPFVEIQEKYKEADIYVLPSLRETTGTAVFEAMANKLPVVSLKQNGVKYIVEEDAGILVDLISKEQVINDMANALKMLIENKKLRRDLGENAFRKIKEKYTWCHRAELMSGCYKEICKTD